MSNKKKTHLTPDINSQTVQNLMIAYYKALFSIHSKHYTLLYGCVRQFAKTFKARKEINELGYIWKNCAGKGFSLSKIEKVVYRDMNAGFPLHKPYNYSFRQNVLFLGDLIQALDEAELKMEDIFAQICRENDIPQSFNLAMLDAVKGDFGMPIPR